MKPQPSAGRCMHSIPFKGYIIVEGPRAVPPLWMLRLVEGVVLCQLIIHFLSHSIVVFILTIYRPGHTIVIQF